MILIHKPKIENIEAGYGEMAQWLKYLVCKYKEQTLGLLSPEGAVWPTCGFILGRWRQGDAHSKLASKTNPISDFELYFDPPPQ